VLGVKAGGYFPGNAAKGITNHQSTVYLFDPDTGRPTAMVGGNLLTALRTAASSAISIDRLARKDARVLGMVGAGHQAAFQLRAAARVRDFDRVVAWNFHPDMLPGLGEVAAELGLPFAALSLEELGAQADVIITITSATIRGAVPTTRSPCSTAPASACRIWRSRRRWSSGLFRPVSRSRSTSDFGTDFLEDPKTYSPVTIRYPGA
jgi:ornithine cyclodeaminase/alanine dehydrogenase-like protein (mu-crystallin family)